VLRALVARSFQVADRLAIDLMSDVMLALLIVAYFPVVQTLALVSRLLVGKFSFQLFLNRTPVVHRRRLARE
jgi:hypothetical protein